MLELSHLSIVIIATISPGHAVRLHPVAGLAADLLQPGQSALGQTADGEGAGAAGEDGEVLVEAGHGAAGEGERAAGEEGGGEFINVETARPRYRVQSTR